MGNVQFIIGNQVSDDPDKNIFDEITSSMSNSDLDSSFENLQTHQASALERIICEYCQEYTYAQFFNQHIRICPCSPSNLRTFLQFNLNCLKEKHQNQNSELEKKICEFCHEPSYLKFHDQHKRICPQNPENIKIYCRYCNHTLNMTDYQTHLQSCQEANCHPRPRSLEPDQKGKKARPTIDRRFKTFNEIQIDESENTKTSDCPICLDDIKTNVNMSILPCSHKFHSRCINHWSTRQKKCPICRQEFF